MATLDERFEKGLEMRGRLAGGQGRIYKGAVPAAYDLAPDMYRISTESLDGSIFCTVPSGVVQAWSSGIGPSPP